MLLLNIEYIPGKKIEVKNLKSLNEMIKRMLMLLKKLLLNYLKQKEIDIISVSYTHLI